MACQATIGSGLGRPNSARYFGTQPLPKGTVAVMRKDVYAIEEEGTRLNNGARERWVRYWQKQTKHRP
ncbi:hypothetical protein [Halomonas casei]|uniref:hypothetical protein n=1 Tax=Halomonas casei TaxID=2742613 RepID=UPI003CEE8E50